MADVQPAARSAGSSSMGASRSNDVRQQRSENGPKGRSISSSTSNKSSGNAQQRKRDTNQSANGKPAADSAVSKLSVSESSSTSSLTTSSTGGGVRKGKGIAQLGRNPPPPPPSAVLPSILVDGPTGPTAPVSNTPSGASSVVSPSSSTSSLTVPAPGSGSVLPLPKPKAIAKLGPSKRDSPRKPRDSPRKQPNRDSPRKQPSKDSPRRSNSPLTLKRSWSPVKPKESEATTNGAPPGTADGAGADPIAKLMSQLMAHNIAVPLVSPAERPRVDSFKPAPSSSTATTAAPPSVLPVSDPAIVTAAVLPDAAASFPTHKKVYSKEQLLAHKASAKKPHKMMRKDLDSFHDPSKPQAPKKEAPASPRASYDDRPGRRDRNEKDGAAFRDRDRDRDKDRDRDRGGRDGRDGRDFRRPGDSRDTRPRRDDSDRPRHDRDRQDDERDDYFVATGKPAEDFKNIKDSDRGAPSWFTETDKEFRLENATMEKGRNRESRARAVKEEEEAPRAEISRDLDALDSSLENLDKALDTGPTQAVSTPSPRKSAIPTNISSADRYRLIEQEKEMFKRRLAAEKEKELRASAGGGGGGAGGFFGTDSSAFAKFVTSMAKDVASPPEPEPSFLAALPAPSGPVPNASSAAPTRSRFGFALEDESESAEAAPVATTVPTRSVSVATAPAPSAARVPMGNIGLIWEVPNAPTISSKPPASSTPAAAAPGTGTTSAATAASSRGAGVVAPLALFGAFGSSSAATATKSGASSAAGSAPAQKLDMGELFKVAASADKLPPMPAKEAVEPTKPHIAAAADVTPSPEPDAAPAYIPSRPAGPYGVAAYGPYNPAPAGVSAAYRPIPPQAHAPPRSSGDYHDPSISEMPSNVQNLFRNAAGISTQGHAQPPGGQYAVQQPGRQPAPQGPYAPQYYPGMQPPPPGAAGAGPPRGWTAGPQGAGQPQQRPQGPIPPQRMYPQSVPATAQGPQQRYMPAPNPTAPYPGPGPAGRPPQMGPVPMQPHVGGPMPYGASQLGELARVFPTGVGMTGHGAPSMPAAQLQSPDKLVAMRNMAKQQFGHPQQPH